MKLGFRSGVSFSNFYNHHSPAEIPRFSSQVNPNKTSGLKNATDNFNLQSYYYETSSIQDMRTGLFSYLFLDWELEKRLSAEMGLGYSQKGINIEYNLNATSSMSDNARANLAYQFSRNLRLDYLMFPATIQYKLGRKERFYVLAGIYNSIALHFLIKKSLVVHEEQTFDSSGQFSSGSNMNVIHGDAYASMFDAGLVGGFGVNFPLTKKVMIGMDVRSGVGMVSIPRKYDEYGFQSFNQSTKNINFETGLNVLYLLK